MLLKNLIENCPENLQEIYVGNIAFREEQCTRDTLFFRLGDKYSEAEAIKRGACCIVTENPAESTVPVIAVNSVRKVWRTQAPDFTAIRRTACVLPA